jgi:hypothetical protein
VTRRPTELWYALAGIAVVTAAYIAAYAQADALPAASSLIGHGIGVLGFVLMLMTATLYPLRKLRTDAHWGSTAAWLRFHMVTGLVGPYLVLLHTAMAFRGLAGLAMLLTVVVVVSGLTGRYLYTRLPRVVAPSTGGNEVFAIQAGAARPSRGLAGRRKALATWHAVHVALTWALFAAALVHVVAALYYATLQR